LVNARSAQHQQAVAPITGKRTDQQLADGRSIHTDYDAHTGAPQQLSLIPSWLIKPTSTPLLSDIQLHPFNGITRATASNGLISQRGYDIAGRLTQLKVNGVIDLHYGYQVGPTIRNLQQQREGQGTDGLQQASFDYNGWGQWRDEQNTATMALDKHPQQSSVSGSNGGASTAANASLRKVAYNSASTNATNVKTSSTNANTNTAQYDRRGNIIQDGEYRYTYNGQGRLVEVHRAHDGKNINGNTNVNANTHGNTNTNLIARYTYNAWGERMSKTVFNASGQGEQQDGSDKGDKKTQLNQSITASIATPTTTYYLYEQQRLAAEMDSKGNITSQYLYMNGTPFAKLESAMSAAQNHSGHSSSARTLAIHTDARGAPLAMTDANRQVVWQSEDNLTDQAWGRLTKINAPAKPASGTQKLLHKISFGTLGDTDQASATLNLRLPGQYHDAETGLHYNYQRYYDAREQINGQPNRNHGRYLTPDPLGYPDGNDPYLYVNHDPINKTDALGLYQEDIHYYMTFFLAIISGMSIEDAQMMALATQYLDDNLATQPVNISPGHTQRLLTYHFVLVPSTVDPATGLLKDNYTSYGYPPNSTDVRNPSSAQLDRLLAAANKSVNNCKLQFYGEYLHAFEDTFGHRNQQNKPYGINLGLGHGASFSTPDYTFDDDYTGDDPIVLARIWKVRSARTLEMELEVFAKLQGLGDPANSAAAKGYDEIALIAILAEFNAIPETSENTGAFKHGIKPDTVSEKVMLLNETLKAWGFTGIDLLKDHAYNSVTGEGNRNKNLCGLNQTDYPGTILPTC
jgi:RHS repeat-associated protein